ncbi:outer membrane protein A precursor [mine drainage metagenome]|uniref:Outer membrane protein A n=1 Tax=mine drainage metagenome TaxID=410659 RepID=A0A1J5S9D2_9ZZZZ
MNKNLINIAVAAALGLAAFSASAEDMYRGAWYAVPGVSYMDTDSDLKADNGAGGFIRLGKELSESWDIQGGLGYTSVSQNTGVAGAGGRYKQTTLGLDALYMFSRDKFRPFLLAGLGAAHNNVDYSVPAIQDKSKTSWLANVGLGAQYLFNDTFGVQADLRHQWTRSSAKAAGIFDAGGTVGNTLFNLGGIFRFGAPAPMPVAAAEPVAEPTPAPAPIVAPEPAPTPEPMPAAAPCKPTLETVTISAEKLFGFDKAKLQEGSKPLLDETAAKINGNPDIELVLVTGHTDRIGSAAYNQKLSERRAKIVKAYLVSKGVAESRLEAVGKGESEPVVACDGVRGKALISCLQPNRRVVISAEKQRESGCK